MTITYHSGKRIQGLSTDTAQTLTYSTDFSASTGWTTSGSFSISGGVANCVGSNNSAVGYVSYDLGSNQSDTAWVLRTKIRFTGLSHTVDGKYAWFGLSSTNGEINANQDFIGFYFASYSAYQYFRGTYNDYNGSTYSDRVQASGNISAYTTNTDYWIEIIRNGNTFIFNTYTASDYSTGKVSKSVSESTRTLTGLRYIKSTGNALNYGSDSGTLTFTLDDIKFYNGVTSIGKPTNVPTGSRFEETDTRKIYFADGTNYAVTPDGMGSSGDLTTGGTITKNATGKLGSYAWNLTSTDGYAEETTTNALASTWSAWTLNVWIKPASIRGSYVFGLTANDGNSNNFQYLITQSGGKLQGAVGSNAGQAYIVSTSSYSTSAWQMATVVYDGSLSGGARLKIYYNGASEGTTVGTPSTSYTLNTYINIGKQDGSGQAFYTGQIDEASIWNRALSSTEIGYLYNSGTGRTIPQAVTDNGLSTTGLKAYYTFEETTGNLINHAVTSPVWVAKA